MQAVRFDRYVGPEVLEAREVEDPVAERGRVLVAVRAAGINPGEIAIREGLLHERWPLSAAVGGGGSAVRRRHGGGRLHRGGPAWPRGDGRGLGGGRRRGLDRGAADASHGRHGDRPGE